MRIAEVDIARFCRASMAALRTLGHGVHARFGPEADARWRMFQGELQDADRLELLIRDASVQHPAAFAPRIVFDLQGLADDEPFGPEWPGFDAAGPSTLFRGCGDATLEDLAAVWGIKPGATPPVQAVTPSSRLVAAGPAAVLALARHMERSRGFDLGDQVTFIGDVPGHRHLFGLAVALGGGNAQARVLHSREAAPGSVRPDLVVVSGDALAEERAAADGLR